MKRILSVLILAGAVAGPQAGGAAGEPAATVVGNRVNLRARPVLAAEVVAQVTEGDTLSVRSVTNEWVEVVPPPVVDLYVHREFIKDGKAQVSPLNVRAGPSINNSKVGTLKKGDSLVVRGEFGDWIKIAPPSESSLWVNRQFLKMAEPKPAVAVAPPAGNIPPKPATAATNAPVVAAHPPPVGPAVAVAAPKPVAMPPAEPPVVPAPAVAAAAARPKPAAEAAPALYVPEDLRLAPVEEQGRAVQREGRVRSPMLTFSRPSKFQLVAEKGGSGDTICYLRGNEEQLRTFENQRLRIRGREYWVQGSRYPVVVVDQIMVVPE